MEQWLFQFSPPRGGRRFPPLRLRSCTAFQFSPPRGGRLPYATDMAEAYSFQFSPPRGGRPTSRGLTLRRTLFQFSPPRGGRRCRYRCSRRRRYFNSRPRVGGVLLHKALVVDVHISILAPAWGASGGCCHGVGEAILFQFSPPRGGRLSWKQRPDARQNFNSRPRVGGVTPRDAEEDTGHYISILAPAWGASCNRADCYCSSLFQFSPPRGGRRVLCKKLDSVMNFNSRPRVGGVRVAAPAALLHPISILAPVWGAS